MSIFYPIMLVLSALACTPSMYSMAEQHKSSIVFVDYKNRASEPTDMRALAYCTTFIQLQKEDIRLLGQVRLPNLVSISTFMSVLHEEIELQDEASKGIPGVPYHFTLPTTKEGLKAAKSMLISKLNASYLCGFELVTAKTAETLRELFPTIEQWYAAFNVHPTSTGQLNNIAALYNQLTSVVFPPHEDTLIEQHQENVIKHFIRDILLIDQQGNSAFCALSALQGRCIELREAFLKHHTTTDLGQEHRDFFGLVIADPQVSAPLLQLCLDLEKKAEKIHSFVLSDTINPLSNEQREQAYIQALTNLVIKYVLPTMVVSGTGHKAEAAQKVEKYIYIAHRYELKLAQKMFNYIKDKAHLG